MFPTNNLHINSTMIWSKCCCHIHYRKVTECTIDQSTHIPLSTGSSYRHWHWDRQTQDSRHISVVIVIVSSKKSNAMMDETDESIIGPDDDVEDPWDIAEEVSYEFIKTGKSKGDGVLTTHDNNFKVLTNYLYLHRTS